MQEFLLKKKWIGFAALVIYSLIVAVYSVKMAKEFVTQYAPVFEREAVDFLPITIQNGEIAEPENTLIQKSYGSGWQSFNVVLDTRSDEFEPSSLQGQGLYVSKKFIYTVANNKIEIHNMKDLPDATLDADTLSAAVQYTIKNIGRWAFPFVLVVVFISMGISVLLYTVLLHWLMAIIFKVKFAHTLRITTLAEICWSLAVLFIGLNPGLLLTFAILVLVNLGVNFAIKPAA